MISYVDSMILCEYVCVLCECAMKVNKQQCLEKEIFSKINAVKRRKDNYYDQKAEEKLFWQKRVPIRGIDKGGRTGREDNE